MRNSQYGALMTSQRALLKNGRVRVRFFSEKLRISLNNENVQYDIAIFIDGNITDMRNSQNGALMTTQHIDGIE